MDNHRYNVVNSMSIPNNKTNVLQVYPVSLLGHSQDAEQSVNTRHEQVRPN